MAHMWSLPRADDDGVLGVHDEPYVPLGSIYHDSETGYVWQYFKAGEALSYGDAVVQSLSIHTITNLATAAPAGTRELNDSGENFLTSLARIKPKNSRQKEFAMLQVISGTGAGQRGIIHEIQQNRLVVEWDSETTATQHQGDLATALATDSDIQIFAPWLAEQSDAADEPTIGFVQQRDGVAQDKYFWALYCGIGKFRAGAAVTAGLALTTDATAGRMGPKGDTADFFSGIALAAGADGDRVWGQLQAALMIGEVPTVTDIGYQPSTRPPPAT
ncbi:MAG: hypothetical protein V6Z81_06480 [Parvularculales bacterium]